MTGLGADLRHALRFFRKNPGFAGLAIATLALGIGSTTAMFSALNALLVRPLPFQAPDRLVVGIALREGFDPFGVSPLEYAAYREGAASFSSSGLAAPRSVNLVEGGEPERLAGAAGGGACRRPLPVGDPLPRLAGRSLDLFHRRGCSHGGGFHRLFRARSPRRRDRPDLGTSERPMKDWRSRTCPT